MSTFPPMPPAPATPIKPHVLRGVLTDRQGNNITTGTPVIAYDETNVGTDRVASRSGGEILLNMANMSDWSFNDVVRIQAIDEKGNGEVYHVSPLSGTGSTDISKTVRPISPVCGSRLDKFSLRSIVKT